MDEAFSGPPRQVEILRRPDPDVQKVNLGQEKATGSGGMKGLNPWAKEFVPGQNFPKSCNMIFILPEEAMAKVDQASVMEGDVVELGETAQILGQSSRPAEVVSSVIILKEQAKKVEATRAASAIFEKPTQKATSHIKPLYVSGYLDGVPVNHLLVDNGSVANLIPRSMMNKLGKTDQDLIASNASLTDFIGGVTTCQGILIMNLTIGSKMLTTPFFVIDSHASFNVLLGRDWIHACMVIPSTLHQCLIFWNQDKVEVVWTDSSPFLAFRQPCRGHAL